MRAALVTLLALVVAAPAAPAVAAPPKPSQLANHCFKIGSLGRFYLKPTRLGGRFMLLDRRGRLKGADAPRVAAEGAIKSGTRGRFAVRSTVNGSALGTHLRFSRAKGCKRFPEAGVNATG